MQMDCVFGHTIANFMLVLCFFVYLAEFYNGRLNNKTRQLQLFNCSFIYFMYHNRMFHLRKKIIANASVR